MSEKNMMIYHVETQEDYDDLMVELEEQGYKWISGDKPTNKPEYWGVRKENTTVILNRFQNYRMTRGALDYHKRTYPFTTVTKHKAKGVKQMEKVVVPQSVADWYEANKKFTMYGLLKRFEVGVKNEQLVYWIEAIGKGEAQRVIAKMHLFQDYEVEEKKYHWRKKKEYMFDFEPKNYINVNKCGRVIFTGIYKGKFTETEIKKLVSEEDFNKLEKVEITE